MVVPAIYLEIGMISEDLIIAGMDGGNGANVLFTTSGVMVKNP